MGTALFGRGASLPTFTVLVLGRTMGAFLIDQRTPSDGCSLKIGVAVMEGEHVFLSRGTSPRGEDALPVGQTSPRGENALPASGTGQRGDDALPAGGTGPREEDALPAGRTNLRGEDTLPAGLSGRGGKLDGQRAGQTLYFAQNLSPACSLRYDWTGWPTDGMSLPPATAAVARDTAALWKQDGFDLLEAHATADKVQLLFGVTPRVSPVLFCTRVKGRLQYSLRKNGTPVDFSRKLAFRSLGENIANVVNTYIHRQVGKGDFADPRFRRIMEGFTVVCDNVDLSVPSESKSGRYWYNLHIVLVVAGRFRITNPGKLSQIRDAALQIVEESGGRISALSIMPDHVHVALRGAIESSPEDIALALQNGLARAAGCRVWQDGYYAGTFSEYDLDVIRRIMGRESPAPTG